jgi:hypothetical protein
MEPQGKPEGEGRAYTIYSNIDRTSEHCKNLLDILLVTDIVPRSLPRLHKRLL